MAISYVSVSTKWSSTASSTSFTINKPANVADGDFLIAVVTFTSGGGGGGQLSVTAPAGWTKEGDVFNAGGGWPCQLAVFTRSALAADPSTWTGTLGSSASIIKVSACVAYRGVASLLIDGTSSSGSGGSSYATATVNNTVANSWRVTIASYESQSVAATIAINETTSRALYDQVNNDNGMQVRLSDSNATVATGNTSRTVSRSQPWDASCSWIGILQVASGTPVTGAFGATLSPVTASAAGDVVDNATMAMTLGNVTMTSSGFGQPPPVDGSAAIVLASVDVSFEAGTPILGEMSMTVLPTIQISAETRAFGNRVIIVEEDTSRRIIVQSRGVDD